MNALEKKTVKVDTTEKDYVIFQDNIGNELAIVTIERLDNGNIYALNIKGTTVRVSVSV